MCLIFHSTEDMVFEEDILVDEDIAVDEALLNDDLTAEDIWAFEQSDIDIARGDVMQGKVLFNTLKKAYLSGKDFDEVALAEELFERNVRRVDKAILV